MSSYCSQYHRTSSNSTFHRIIAVVLLYSQLLPMAVAALVPNTQSPRSLTPVQTDSSLNNLSLTNRHLNLKGPLDWGITYSDLTGTYFNAQYVAPLGERFAFGVLGEYGNDQYRLNGTLGYGFSPLSQIKATVERLGQRLPFQFDSGDLRARVHQDAYGVQLQHLLNDHLIRGVNARGYWAQAANKDLNPVLFTSNGFNCGGFAAGLECINYRYLAGATSQGLDAGVDALVTPSTLVQGTLYYDQVRYNTRFSPVSQYDRNGLGLGIKIEQLFNEQFKLSGEATVREIYDTYQAGVSMLPSWRLNTEVSITGQRIVSRNAIPDNNSISVGFKLFGDGKRRYEKEYLIDHSLTDIHQWVRTPAVKMQQVLITAEQYTKLLAPSINSISPNNGPLAGGNTVTISGSNFMPGLTVFFGGQAATNIQLLSSTTIKVVVPALPGILTESVDVVIQNPDGQQTFAPKGYTYASASVPAVTLINPNTGTSAGGTTVIISGSNLDTTQSVTFGGIAATLTQITSNQLTVITPSHPAGLVSIVVTTSSGSIEQPNAYTYVPLSVPTNVAIDSSGTTVTGNGEPGTTAEVRNSSGIILGSSIVGGNGNFSLVLDYPQTNGEILYVTLKDAAGNTSASTSVVAPTLP
ncbi:IPT/TIG domain-containing protein [uncultured Legionella sp.]|uniref:IPT/TIG domain-containing protein n=1 Tax=uncultured Legionella sp. TaxID=210934 RepID=UPI002620A392|nr:IPT/TIG domain-containing protein [uncultured Legionella sp.]